MEEKKLSEEQYNKLLSFQKQLQELVADYGHLHYQKRVVNTKIEEVELLIDELQNEQYEMLQRLQETYGDGQINLSSGTFIPDKPLNS